MNQRSVLIEADGNTGSVGNRALTGTEITYRLTEINPEEKHMKFLLFLT